MMSVIASIQARMESSRLPGKALLPLHNQPILELVRKRATQTRNIDEVVFAVGDNSPNDAITLWCRRNSIRYVVGPEDNLLKRHMAVVNEMQPDVLVRITGDCPFIPPSEIDRIISLHQSNDKRYTTNYTKQMPIGTAVDIIEPSLLKELQEIGEDHPVRKIRNQPDRYRTEFSENPEWCTFANAHMAVDTPADYWHLYDAIDAVGTSPKAVAKWISGNEGSVK